MPKVTINVPLLGGVDLLHDPAAIPDNKVVEASNLFPTISGQLEKRAAMTVWRSQRPGFPLLSNYLYANASNIAVQAFHACSGKFPFDFVTASCTSAGATITINGQTQAIGTTLGARPRILEWNNDIIILPNNNNKPGFIIYRYNPLTLAWEFVDWNFVTGGLGVPAQFSANTLFPKVAIPYNNSMLYANLGPGYERSLLFADGRKPANYSATPPLYYPTYCIVADNPLANNRFIDVLGGDGASITGMAEIELASVGQVRQQAALVLTEFDAFIVMGRPEPSDSIAEDKFGTYSNTRINYRVGCVAHETIRRTPYGLIWASQEDVWVMNGLNQPVSIGTYLRPFLRDAAPEARWTWHAVYESAGVYRLIVGTQIQTVDLSGVGSGPFMDDPTYVEFWLDLRDQREELNAATARWFGPIEYKPYGGGGGVLALQGPRAAVLKPGLQGETLCPVRTVDVYDVGGAYGGVRGVVADVSAVRQVTVPPYDAATSTFASSVWQAASTYNQGDVVRPRIFAGNYFVCTTAGTTSASEPSWPTGSGGAVGDGTVTWTEWRNGGTVLGNRISDFGDTHAVLMDLKTKNYDMGDTHVDKTFVKAEVEAFANKPAYLKLDVIQEDGAVTEQATAQMSQADGMVAGGVFGTLQEMFQNRSMRPSDTLRIVSKRQQFELFDGTEYVVDASNNTLYLGFYSNGNKTASALDVLPVVIASGTYADAAALRTALQTALRAIVGTSLTLSGALVSTLWPSTAWSDWTVGVDATAGNVQMSIFSVLMPVPPVVWTCNDALMTAAQKQVGAACMSMFGMEEWPTFNYGADSRWWSVGFEYVSLTAQQAMFTSNIATWKLTDLSPTVDFHGKRPFTKGQAK